MSPVPSILSVEQIMQGLDGHTSDGEHYVLPRFQRKSVWNNNDNQALIDSMRKGWPIGSIMIASNSDYKPKDYLIIDGQQRIRAIKDCIKNPINYFDFDGIAKIVFKALKESNFINKKILESEDSENISRIKNIIKNFFNERFEGKMPGEDIVILLDNNNFTERKNSLELSKIINKLVGDEINSQSIVNYKIPLIRFMGDQNQLSEVFEVINKKGTKLNKYDILKARWDNIRFKIKDEKIMEKLRLTYEELSRAIEIQDFNYRTFSEEDINLAEYLIGFGKKIYSLESGRLFGKSIDDIGFKLFLSVSKNHLQKTESIKKFFLKNNFHEDSLKLKEFQEKIEEIIDFVYKLLERYIDFCLNKKRINSNKFSPSQVQIMTIIGCVFNSRYDIENSFSEKETWGIDREKYKKFLHLHFIKEVIQGTWDSKHPEDIGQERINNSHYSRKIEKKEWDNAFSVYLEKSLEKNKISFDTKKRIVYRPADQLFLSYLYINQIKYNKEIYEIEHIIPYNRLVNRLKKMSIDSIPINSIGNLALITKKINSKKGDKTFAEFEENKGKEKLIGEERFYYDYDKKSLFFGEDIIIPKEINGEDSFDTIWYENFLKNRFNILKNKFYEFYGIN